MSNVITGAITDTLLDTLRLLPFLFLTYLAMEYLEHRAAFKTQQIVERAGKWGPVLGGIIGIVPQCGFSAAASNLYAGRVITLGTLFAIYLSTSDEMIPIMISSAAPAMVIVQILAIKAVVGMAAGLLIDLAVRFFSPDRYVHMNTTGEMKGHLRDICESEHCNCGKEGIFRSALRHTLQITGFLLIITFVLNLILGFGGEEVLSGFLTNRPIMGPVISGLVGLIPNCAASVVITRLYLEGAMSFGAMISGLLTGCGVGILVLCRVNHSKRENLGIILLLYLIGVTAGILAGALFR